MVFSWHSSQSLWNILLELHPYRYSWNGEPSSSETTLWGPISSFCGVHGTFHFLTALLQVLWPKVRDYLPLLFICLITATRTKVQDDNNRDSNNLWDHVLYVCHCFVVQLERKVLYQEFYVPTRPYCYLYYFQKIPFTDLWSWTRRAFPRASSLLSVLCSFQVLGLSW
jgi:hypothetical protein